MAPASLIRPQVTKTLSFLLPVVCFLIISCHSSIVDEFEEHEFGIGENWIPQKRQIGEAIEDEEEQDRAMEKIVGAIELDSNQKFVAEFTQTTTKFEIIIEITNEYYCEKFGNLHVLCAYKDTRPGTVYYDRGVNETEQDFILKFIVRLRKRVLTGKETEGNPGPLPKALRLRVLKWSEELQVFAQRIANQCKSTLNQTIVYSTDTIPRLTISIAMSFDTIEKPRWTQALRHWYNEVKNVKPDVIYREGAKMNHYTAMVWGSTGWVGCGYSCVKGKKPGVKVKTYVCVFGPGGNINNKKIYPTSIVDFLDETTTAAPTPAPGRTTTTEAPQVQVTTRKNPFKKLIQKEEWDLG